MQSTTTMLGAFAARRLADDELFDHAVRGDAVAFSEFYRRYERRVHGFCLARSLDPEAARDATQEVFIRLLNSQPGSVEHPRAWLFTVARNVVIDTIRKRALLRETGEVDEDAPAWQSQTAADTADEVSSRAGARGVFLALRRMKPRYRTALILREIHGQSSADIAEAMGVRSAGAVDTLVCRARDAFGVAYADVSELPPACRQGVELMYRSRGTGLNAHESESLRVHLASCERCRHEEERADDPARMSGLLPLLVPAGAAAHTLLGRAASIGSTLSRTSLVQWIAEAYQAHLQTAGARIAAGAIAATLIVAPVVTYDVIHRAQSSPATKVTRAVAVAAAAHGASAGFHGSFGSVMGGTHAALGGMPGANPHARGSARSAGPMPAKSGRTSAMAHKKTSAHGSAASAPLGGTGRASHGHQGSAPSSAHGGSSMGRSTVGHQGPMSGRG